jgi:hypothetical protein
MACKVLPSPGPPGPRGDQEIGGLAPLQGVVLVVTPSDPEVSASTSGYSLASLRDVSFTGARPPNRVDASGAALRSNTIHHESANAPNSHYYQYRVAQDDPSNNIANAVEVIVATPTENFTDKYQAAVGPRTQTIQQAQTVEPCGGLVNRDHVFGCTPLGKINYTPYQPCP